MKELKSVIILNRKLLTYVEIVVKTVIVNIDKAEALIDRGHLQPFKQMPLWFAEIIGATVEDDTVGYEIKIIIAAADTLVARLQQVFMLTDHAKTENAVHGDDKLG
jgi:hypothetical protein